MSPTARLLKTSISPRLSGLESLPHQCFSQKAGFLLPLKAILALRSQPSSVHSLAIDSVLRGVEVAKPAR